MAECSVGDSPKVGNRRFSPDRSPHPHITREILEKHGSYALDFRGEALTFKVEFISWNLLTLTCLFVDF